MQQRRRAVLVHASEGVQDLLARDRKRKTDLAPELLDEPTMAPEAVAPEAVEAAAAAAPESSSKRGGGRFKSRQQRRRDMAATETVGGRQG